MTAEIFADGSYVDVTGTSKGKSFAGTMKRHGFRGQAPVTVPRRCPSSIGTVCHAGANSKGTQWPGGWAKTG